MHPLHVTLTSIDIDENSNMVNITIKVFSDDFETVLRNHSGKEINLNAENENNEVNTIISSYINESFSIFFDNKKADLNYISKKNNHEATWISFYASLKDYDQFIIKNKILLDLYEDQKNLIILRNGSKEKGYNLDFKKREIVFTKD